MTRATSSIGPTTPVLDGQLMRRTGGPADMALVVRHPERGRSGPAMSIPTTPLVAPVDGLVDDDLVESLARNARSKGRARRPRLTGYSGVARSIPRRAAAMMWSRSCSPPRLRFIRLVRAPGGGDVVLAVRAADVLVHGSLDGQRARLDELGPVELLEVGVEAAGPPRGDGDQVDGTPNESLVGSFDPLAVGKIPHSDRRVTAPPRWQCSSASELFRASWAMAQEELSQLTAQRGRRQAVERSRADRLAAAQPPTGHASTRRGIALCATAFSALVLVARPPAGSSVDRRSPRARAAPLVPVAGLDQSRAWVRPPGVNQLVSRHELRRVPGQVIRCARASRVGATGRWRTAKPPRRREPP